MRDSPNPHSCWMVTLHLPLNGHPASPREPLGCAAPVLQSSSPARSPGRSISSQPRAQHLPAAPQPRSPGRRTCSQSRAQHLPAAPGTTRFREDGRGSPVPGSWLLVRGRGNGISQGCRENTGGSSMGSKRSSRLTDDVGLARALLRSGIWGGCVGPTGKMYKLSFPKCGCQEKRWPLPRVAFLPFLSRWSRDAGSSVVNFMGWRIYRDRGKSRGGRR